MSELWFGGGARLKVKKSWFSVFFFITGQKGRNLWVTLFSGPCLVYPYSGRWRHCFIRLWCHVGWPISSAPILTHTHAIVRTHGLSHHVLSEKKKPKISPNFARNGSKSKSNNSRVSFRDKRAHNVQFHHFSMNFVPFYCLNFIQKGLNFQVKIV